MRAARTMRSSLRIVRAGLVVATIALGLGIPEASHAVLGPIYVVDRDVGGGGKVIRVNRQTGNQSVVSNDSRFRDPFGITMAANGTLLVADQGALGGQGAIFRVNPVNGNTTVVSSHGRFRAPSGIAVEESGRIVVADPAAFPDRLGGVIRVNPANGNQTVVSRGGMFVGPRGLTVAPNGSIFVADESAFPPGSPGGVIRVNPQNGNQTEVASRQPFINPLGIERASTGRIIVGDETAPGGSGGGTGGVFRVNPRNGNVTKVASGNNLNTVSGVDILPNDNILVANQNGLQGDDGGIVRVNAQTGAQSVVSQGGFFRDPVDVVIP
jgi:sugar lactone lactonase YvrE